MIRTLGIVILIFICTSFYGQENTLIGKWKVVEAQSGEFYLDVKKDCIIVSDKMKKWYPTKIGMQDEIASIRMNHSHKMFVFTDNYEFYDYSFPNSKSAIFTGKYTIEGKSNLKLEVFNRAKIKLEKKASFYFKDSLLHLIMHEMTNSPVEYVLQKVEE